MECPICLQEWNDPIRIPRSLQCGHSFCEECLQAILVKKKSLPCPTCGCVQNLPSAGGGSLNPKDAITTLPKNFSLISILIEKSSVPAIPVKSASSPAQQNRVLPSFSEQDLEAAFSKSKGICEKHNLALHSVVVSTRALICDKCISELPKGTQIQLLPRVAQALVEQLAQAKKRIIVKRGELTRCRMTMERIVEKNAADIEYGIADHFRKIKEIVADGEKMVREKCKAVKAKQSENVENYIVFLILIIR